MLRIDEYIKVPDPGFKMPDFTGGQRVGIIQTGAAGPLHVWKLIDQDQIGYAAVDPKIGAKSPVSFLGFYVGQNVLVAKNALTEPTYQRKGISSELFLFVNKVEGHKILSDIELTDSGESLWQSFIASSKFNTKIIYLPTSEVFELTDIGSATTQDGTLVDSPNNDDKEHGFYNATSNKGQRFFYLIEVKDRFSYYYDGKLYEHHGVDVTSLRSLGSILQPYRNFTNDDP